MNNYKLQYWPGFFEARQSTGNIINESGSLKQIESQNTVYTVYSIQYTIVSIETTEHTAHRNIQSVYNTVNRTLNGKIQSTRDCRAGHGDPGELIAAWRGRREERLCKFC